MKKCKYEYKDVGLLNFIGQKFGVFCKDQNSDRRGVDYRYDGFSYRCDERASAADCRVPRHR